MTVLKTPANAWIITMRCNTWRQWGGPCLEKTKANSRTGCGLWPNNSRTNRPSKSFINWKRFWLNCQRDRRLKQSKRKSITFTSTRTGWITALDGDGASPLAAERLNRPVGKLNAASNGQANTGVNKETNLYCAWRPSGATDAGISCSRIIANSTPPKTEMRTLGPQISALTGARFPANLFSLRQPSEAETFFAGGRSGIVCRGNPSTEAARAEKK